MTSCWSWKRSKQTMKTSLWFRVLAIFSTKLHLFPLLFAPSVEPIRAVRETPPQSEQSYFKKNAAPEITRESCLPTSFVYLIWLLISLSVELFFQNFQVLINCQPTFLSLRANQILLAFLVKLTIEDLWKWRH